MNDRIYSVMFVVSLVVLIICTSLTGANFIFSGEEQAGFLPDIAVKIMGIASGAALVLLVFSRIKQNQRK